VTQLPLKFAIGGETSFNVAPSPPEQPLPPEIFGGNAYTDWGLYTAEKDEWMAEQTAARSSEFDEHWQQQRE